jgi:hypothetical protein
LAVDWVDEVDFKENDGLYERLPSECRYLGSILAVAVTYNVPDLASMAEEKIEERLDPLKSHSPPDAERLGELVRGLVKAFYPEHEVQHIRTFQLMVAGMLLRHWSRRLESSVVKDLIIEHPELGWDLFEVATSEIGKLRETMECMKDDLPKNKRKRYESEGK